MNWNTKGIKIKGEYADDIVLFADNTEKLTEMGKEAEKIGLKINYEETKTIKIQKKSQQL